MFLMFLVVFSSGNDLGVAFEIPQQLKSQPFFASCVLKVSHQSNAGLKKLTGASFTPYKWLFFLSVFKNAELKFNFGGEDFKNAPKSGFVAMDQAPEGHAVKSTQAGVWIPPYFICKNNRYRI